MPVPDRVAATYLRRKSRGRLESLALAVQRDGCPDQMREGSLSVFPRQSPSSFTLRSISLEAGAPLLLIAADFFATFTDCWEVLPANVFTPSLDLTLQRLGDRG